MTDEIVLHSPIDAHLHVRQGEMLRHVVPLTAATFAAAIVMPNTDPPVKSATEVSYYFHEIAEAAADASFRPCMTAYFGSWLTGEVLERLQPHITAVKFYPFGLTTGSSHGCDPADPFVDRVLSDMEQLGITLCVHPESPGYHEDREELFGVVVQLWASRYPRLKIVLEHISDKRTIYLLTYHENLYATITPQHLLLTGDDWVGPPLRPHLYCMPVAKRPSDRDFLVRLATGDEIYWGHKLSERVMLGTDSAPHPVGKKEAADCCAGIFSAPIALQLVAEVFERAGALNKLQGFVSDNARRIHGIVPPEKVVTLVRKPFVVPERYGDVVPMFAGRTLNWSVAV